jgi:uncharacterized membrane protein YphA (DoxX/SURF4 family)
MASQPKAMTWAGRILTAFVGLMLLFSASMKFQNPPEVSEQMVGKFGYPKEITFTIGVLEATCAIIYLIPQTTVLGAVLLTGYLGGAIATHVRVSDPFWGPLIGGVLVWLGVFLRDPRVRALLPFRGSIPPTDAQP